MKDSFAREKLEVMDGDLGKLVEFKGALGDVSVRHCKKCKHDTLQRRKLRYNFGWVLFGSSGSTSGDYDYECLNCGTKWECRRKEVCTEVKPKLAKKKTTKKSK